MIRLLAFGQGSNGADPQVLTQCMHQGGNMDLFVENGPQDHFLAHLK